MSNSHIEIEIRCLVDNTEMVEKNLYQEGFVLKEEYEQHDIILDDSEASLFKSGQKIRIRNEKEQAELTYKGKFNELSKASKRTELNIPINPDSIQSFIEFLEAIGYPMLFQIKKKRKVYQNSKNVKVTIDAFPILGYLIEIEGEENTIWAISKSIAPMLEFKNYRLKDLFSFVTKKKNKSIQELKKEYEAEAGYQLGHIEMILN